MAVRLKFSEKTMFIALPLFFGGLIFSVGSLWRDAIGGFITYCQQSITKIFNSGGGGHIFILILLSLVLLAMLGKGLYIIASEIWRLRQFKRLVERLAIPIAPRLARLQRLINLNQRVDLVKGDQSLAFVYGFLRPRLLITDVALDILTDQELLAVLKHEKYHADKRHPLMSFVHQIIQRSFFFLPALKDYQKRAIISRELEADDYCLNQHSTKKELASAMLKFSDQHTLNNPLPSAVLCSSFSVINNARLLKLINNKTPTINFSRRSLAISLAAAMAVTIGWGLLVSHVATVQAGQASPANCLLSHPVGQTHVIPPPPMSYEL